MTIRCPRCQILSRVDLNWHWNTVGSQFSVAWGITFCLNDDCYSPILLKYDLYSQSEELCYPTATINEVNLDGVPATILEYYTEILQTFEVSLKGCVLLCRMLLESELVSLCSKADIKLDKKPNLKVIIETVLSNKLVGPDMAISLNAVKNLGNIIAHRYEFQSHPQRDQVQWVVDVLRSLLLEIHVIPSINAAMIHGIEKLDQQSQRQP